MMALKTLSAKNAALLDSELMGSGAFSLDQLMELAGLSVSQAVYRVQPPSQAKRILVACGPGNNGGDGLVAARHLYHFGYRPTVYYPKPGKNALYQRLTNQLRNLQIPFTTDFGAALTTNDQVLDAIFGFSFSGEVREPFPSVIAAMAATSLPVTSVDAPSSWNIETGPPDEGPGREFMPDVLVSLTAPKPLVKWFRGKTHFVGGRFLSVEVAERYGLVVPPYEGSDQVVEVPVNQRPTSMMTRKSRDGTA